jgi:hypothetical protein
LQVVSYCRYRLNRDAFPASFTTEDIPDARLDIVPDVALSAAEGTIFYDDGMISAWYSAGYLTLGFRPPQDNDAWPYNTLRLEQEKDAAVLHIRHQGVERAGWIHPFERPAAEIILQHMLCRRGALLLHASGINYHGAGYVFVGASGSGKSTISCLWHGIARAAVLSDEKVVVQRDDAGFFLHGTPWGSSTRPYSRQAPHRGQSCPLRAVFLLEHAPNNAISRLTPAEAVPILFSQSFPSAWNLAATAANLRCAADLASWVPCYRLGFVPNASVIAFIQGISDHER